MLKPMKIKIWLKLFQKVLYPEDNHYEGKLFEIEAAVFLFVSATIQWIISKHKQKNLSMFDIPEYADSYKRYTSYHSYT